MAGGGPETTEATDVPPEALYGSQPELPSGGQHEAPSGGQPEAPSGDRRWAWALGAVCLVALAVRLVYIFGWQAVDEVTGDAYYYHAAANLLADGEGFVHPYYLRDDGVRAPGADHPPGYSTVLAVASFLGFDGIRSHQVVTALIGTATVALMGLVGRRVAGRGVGLLAAGFAAVYPNMWLNDGVLMSESLAMLLGVAVSLVAYRAWDQPSSGRMAVLGGMLGVATLARAEAALLAVLLILPLCVWAPRLEGWRERLHRLAVAGVVLGLVLAPWVVPNLLRFERPATLSTQAGPTLEVANCDEAYHGSMVGSWTTACRSMLKEAPDGVVWRYLEDRDEPQEPLPEVTDPYDRSELDSVTREVAFRYMGENRGRLPFVVWARFGRAWGLYQPDQQLRIDDLADSRPYEAGRAGLLLYYPTVAAAVAGVVALRRRGVPSFPLTAWIVNVAITVVAFYGTTRFRAPAEPALVLLGAVGAAWMFSLARTRLDGAARSGPDESGSEPDRTRSEASAAPQ